MRIAVIGGGPGGLFFSVLMKRTDPSHQITVFERNRPDATFGFGVVFPERSLRYLGEADETTHAAFTEAMIHWDAIEYRHGGRSLRCGGHVFSGIARMDLLRILQRQARGLGVDLRFEHDVTRLETLSGADLIVAADGLNSMARRALEARFRPSVHVGRSKYIWLGTTQTFTALTFIFEEDAHGWWGAHIYPHGGGASTFIVETDEDTWRRAGLDRPADDAEATLCLERDTLASCQRVFARHLDGHRLLANASRWASFRTVRNRAWHAGNVVLLGDAAHTAHFSVGSGTRMALGDAIALAQALRVHDDLDQALSAYERDRRAAVVRIQRAAGPSRRWWEGFRIWTRFAPEQFAFHHLARTRMLTYGMLTVRDRGFVEAAEAWFARARGAGPAGEAAPAPVATPLCLRSVLFPNRIVARAGVDRHADAGLVFAESAAELPPPGVARQGLRLDERSAPESASDVARVLTDRVRGATDRLDLLLFLHGRDLRNSSRLADLVSALNTIWPVRPLIAVELEAWADPEDDEAIAEGLTLARALKAHGCALIAVAPPPRSAARDPERAREAHAHASDLIRNLADLPTMMLGGDYSVGDVNALLLAGRTDLCEWPRLAWAGWRPTGAGSLNPPPAPR